MIPSTLRIVVAGQPRLFPFHESLTVKGEPVVKRYRDGQTTLDVLYHRGRMIGIKVTASSSEWSLTLRGLTEPILAPVATWKQVKRAAARLLEHEHLRRRLIVPRWLELTLQELQEIIDYALTTPLLDELRRVVLPQANELTWVMWSTLLPTEGIPTGTDATNRLRHSTKSQGHGEG